MTQLSNLLLYNQNGGIDANRPFHLLGNPSNKDSYFIFGSKEWLNKKISEVTLKITWEKNLPNNFASYYSAYSWYLGKQFGHFKNNSFVVAFSVLIEGEWITSDTKSFNLFKDNKEDASVYKKSEFKLSFDKNLLFFESNENSEILELSETQDGFMKMQLVEPEYGFGTTLYPEVVSAVALYNAERISSGRQKRKLLYTPNLPYSPLVEKIEVHITA